MKTKTSYPVISEDAAIQQEYVKLRKKGESHSFAEMLAMRAPPGTMGTERALMFDSINMGLKHMTDAQREWKIKQAIKAGVNPHGKVHMPELGRHGVENDPICWVSDSHDVVEALKKTGRGCPQLGIKPAQYVHRDPPKRLSESIIKERMQDALSAMDPRKAKEVDKRKLREEIIEKHGAKKAEL